MIKAIDIFKNRSKTAINSKSPSVPTRLAYSKGFIRETVLDWGCGKKRDTNWLHSQNIQTYYYDILYESSREINLIDFQQVKTILLNYVLNVIEEPQERIDLLNEIKSHAFNETILLMSARSEKEIKQKSVEGKWLSYNDGYITNRNTFQKGFSFKEIREISLFMGEILEIHETASYISSIIKLRK